MSVGEIPDLLVLEPAVSKDDRGFFLETSRRSRLSDLGVNYEAPQDNHSGSRRGVLRGLHYQIRQPQGKQVRVVVGEVFDVAVDLRRSSQSFCRWAGVNLSADNKKNLWVPLGFAHGFYTLSERAEVMYKVTACYAPEHERMLVWNDPDVAIEWPLVDGQPPILSDKVAPGVHLQDAESYE